MYKNLFWLAVGVFLFVPFLDKLVLQVVQFYVEGDIAYGSLSEGWWRWGESNPRPKQLQPNFYACILPLISQEVCQQAGLSSSNRSVIRTSAPERRAPKQVLLSYAAAA